MLPGGAQPLLQTKDEIGLDRHLEVVGSLPPREQRGQGESAGNLGGGGGTGRVREPAEPDRGDGGAGAEQAPEQPCP